VWLTCSMGIMAGALGSSFGTEVAVRRAAFSRRERQRQARHGPQNNTQDNWPRLIRKSPLTSTVDHRLATDTASHTPCAAGYFVARREDIRDDVSAKLEAALGHQWGSFSAACSGWQPTCALPTR
jgi:hypothetical protein